MKDKLRMLRKEYTAGGLRLADTSEDPFEQFEHWMGDAVTLGIGEVNAMTLATVGSDGMPSARTVLLKSYDRRGMVFFTNYSSRKGRDLERNPGAALLFYWEPLERQIRIEGLAERCSRPDSEIYFKERPIGSQIAAACSPQSQPIGSRDELERAVESMSRDLAGRPPACPESWGGFRVVPSRFEFWQGRENRLHDRIEYLPSARGGWRRHRLAP